MRKRGGATPCILDPKDPCNPAYTATSGAVKSPSSPCTRFQQNLKVVESRIKKDTIVVSELISNTNNFTYTFEQFDPFIEHGNFENENIPQGTQKDIKRSRQKCCKMTVVTEIQTTVAN
jgi:hypothetical protein